MWIHENNVQQTNKIIRSKNKSTVKKWDENKDKNEILQSYNLMYLGEVY